MKISILHASHILNPTPPSGYGGIELVVDTLARYQLKEGLNVKVLGITNPTNVYEYEIIPTFKEPVKKPLTWHKIKYMVKLLKESVNVDTVHLHVQ
ncbi:hypothetical protein JCM16161A_22050 [Vulcanisaeta sp. JCM 16161]|uniref:hypothetical protein n=1 Tax=Vulcanisaeta sp. JCM 16161 TaxID=1295372 RepID=UPI0006CF3001|nr:hypothetical protein [Vulcanisaeta sp. JCM 16161]